jgi:hypothetical protein
MSEPTYLDEIAAAIRAATPLDRLPDEDRLDDLFRLYALLALAKGEAVTARDVHNAWGVWMLNRGEAHDRVVPYGDLAAEVQKEDEPFVISIREVSPQLRSRQCDG